MNRVLRDRAMRRGGRRDRAMDSRNPYGSKGGYISSSRRGRDRAMDNRDYYSEYDSRYDSRYDERDRNQGNDYRYQQPREHNRPMEYEMYGKVRPRDSRDYDERDYNDYGDYNDYNDYNDYGDYADYDYAMEEKEYKKKLKEWTEKLKHKDRFHKEKQEILQMAKSMGATFEDYNEEEFVAVYYMTVSDYRNEIIASPQMAVLGAIDWIEDEDVANKGSEKLCSYLYYTVLGKTK